MLTYIDDDLSIDINIISSIQVFDSGFKDTEYMAYFSGSDRLVAITKSQYEIIREKIKNPAAPLVYNPLDNSKEPEVRTSGYAVTTDYKKAREKAIQGAWNSHYACNCGTSAAALGIPCLAHPRVTL